MCVFLHITFGIVTETSFLINLIQKTPFPANTKLLRDIESGQSAACLRRWRIGEPGCTRNARTSTESRTVKTNQASSQASEVVEANDKALVGYKTA
jgi:hypothetical protein